MDKFTIVFYVEDMAQETFIRALVERLIVEEGRALPEYDLEVLYARGGGSIRAYKDFIKQARRGRHLRADVLIVGSDANCKGFTERKRQLIDAAKNMPHPPVITAIPDPHIERWYLLDRQALARAAGVPVQVVSPTAKCGKDIYKKLLKAAFASHNLFPPLGGTEYGPQVAKTMDLYLAGKADHSLADFVDQVRAWLRQR